VTVLLDANVLIALLVDDQVHHGAAENWFAGLSENFAACPVIQGSLMRLLIPKVRPPAAARDVLSQATTHPPTHPRPAFWPHDFPYTDVPVQGNREPSSGNPTRSREVAGPGSHMRPGDRSAAC
jgi:uncharacterized protein